MMSIRGHLKSYVEENRRPYSRPYLGFDRRALKDGILYSSGNGRGHFIVNRPYPTETFSVDHKELEFLSRRFPLKGTWGVDCASSPLEHHETQILSNPLFYPDHKEALILSLFLRRERIVYEEKISENATKGKYRALSYRLKDYYEEYANEPLTCQIYTEALPFVYLFSLDVSLQSLKWSLYDVDHYTKSVFKDYEAYVLQRGHENPDPVKSFTQNFNMLGVCLSESTSTASFSTVVCTFEGNPLNASGDYLISNGKGVAVHRAAFLDLDELDDANEKTRCLPFNLYLFVGLNTSDYLKGNTVVLRIVKSRLKSTHDVLSRCIHLFTRFKQASFLQHLITASLQNGNPPALGAIQKFGYTCMIAENEEEYMTKEKFIIFPKLYVSISKDWRIH